MYKLVRHSAVVTGSAFAFGELGRNLGERASALHLDIAHSPMPSQAFETLGHIAGGYVGIVSAVGGIVLGRCRSETGQI